MYQASCFWLYRSRGVSTQRHAFGDENPHGAALPCPQAPASLHQPKETQSAAFTHGDLINRHPTDFSKSSTLTPSITKLFWWKWLKLTIIISFRYAPRGFGEAQASLFAEQSAKKSLSWRAHPPQRQGNQGIAERKARRQKIFAQGQKAGPWQS